MRSLCLALTVVGQAVIGSAQPARYSFSGQISSLHHDGAGILAAQGVAVGDPVAVTFDVDFGMPGRAVLNDGTVEILSPYVWDDLRIHYFYARLVSGTRFPEVNGGMYNEPEDVSEYLAGWNRSDWTDNEGVLIGGSRDSYFRLERHNPLPVGGVPDWQVQDWQIGTVMEGAIVGWSDLDYSMVRADLRLDSITAIPEPSVVSLLLMGGLSGVLWGRRRSDKFAAVNAGEPRPLPMRTHKSTRPTQRLGIRTMPTEIATRRARPRRTGVAPVSNFICSSHQQVSHAQQPKASRQAPSRCCQRQARRLRCGMAEAKPYPCSRANHEPHELHENKRRSPVGSSCAGATKR